MADNSGVLRANVLNGFGVFIGGVLVAVPFIHPTVDDLLIRKGLQVRSTYGI
jgi:hypothetical protein